MDERDWATEQRKRTREGGGPGHQNATATSGVKLTSQGPQEAGRAGGIGLGLLGESDKAGHSILWAQGGPLVPGGVQVSGNPQPGTSKGRLGG